MTTTEWPKTLSDRRAYLESSVYDAVGSVTQNAKQKIASILNSAWYEGIQDRVYQVVSLKELRSKWRKVHNERIAIMKELLSWLVWRSFEFVDWWIKSGRSILRKHKLLWGELSFYQNRLSFLDLSRCRIICDGIDDMIIVMNFLKEQLWHRRYKICFMTSNYWKEGKYQKQFWSVAIYFTDWYQGKIPSSFPERFSTEIQLVTANTASVMDINDPRMRSISIYVDGLLALANYQDLEEYLEKV